MIISTVILSWNRPALLQRTIASYAATTRCEHELFLVDNGSDDDTKDVIREAERAGVLDRVLLLDRNEGGLALNRLLPETSSPLVHISENDIEYLPGWDEAVLRAFDTFPELGQLSLFSPWPQTDDGEIWVDEQAHEPLEADGVVIYLTSSVTATCVIRREVVERGTRFHNVSSIGRFELLDDCEFSAQVRALGLQVAWGNRYLVKNWGHNVAEMRDNVEYYVENYANKDWVGVAGLEERLAKHGFRLVAGHEGTTGRIEPLP